jgi:hypothetical protein
MPGISHCHHVYNIQSGEVYYRRLTCHCQSPNICYCFFPVCHGLLQYLLGNASLAANSNVSQHAPTEMKENDFVFVRVLPDKAKLSSHPTQQDYIYYIGTVMQWVDSPKNSCSSSAAYGWQLKCMRRKYTRQFKFSFPTQDDIAVFHPSDVVKRLFKHTFLCYYSKRSLR